MSALPKYPRDIGYAGLRMTADEYLALGETPERYELIDGMVVMSPSPIPLQNEVALEIAFQLKAHAARAEPVRVFPETDVRFADGTVYRPDLCAYRAGRLPSKVEHLDAPPDLIVEILSPGSKPLDLITKRDDYERFGVGEYWAVDPSNAMVRCWRRQGARLLETPVEGDTVPSGALAGFSLDLRPLRAIIQGS